MVTKQLLKGLPEDSDLRRADFLAQEIFADVANMWAFLIDDGRDGCGCGPAAIPTGAGTTRPLPVWATSASPCTTARCSCPDRPAR
ncbi:hypothetical protein GCM10010279_29440 [Streptomyces mutabilis]|nr:hypothetical protein GCM10010279_29440 [Streptomyces mutabilis]